MKHLEENYLVVFSILLLIIWLRLDPSEGIFARSSSVDHLLY